MVSTGFVIGAIFIIGLFVLGVMQTNLPRSSLAGAVVMDSPKQSQQTLNLCMNDCMRGCVTVEGTEQMCLDQCNLHCDVS
jgi:hypothetical protein